MSNITTVQQTATVKLGWVSGPGTRGTLDIIWSCVVVLIISVWSVMHINVPREGEGTASIMLRKLGWAVWLAFAPEVVMLMAAVQWQSARESYRNMRAIGVDHWTIVHGFFADSGGLVIELPDSPPFPINSRALLYLVREGYVDAPAVTRKELNDRSNADWLGKSLALVQSLYLICQVIARGIQGLDITCLEITTLAFLWCTAFTYWFWINKPLDAEIPLRIQSKASLATILSTAGQPPDLQYDDTPMDFVEQPGWRVWRRRKIFRNFGGLTERPICRIPNDYAILPSLEIALVTWFLTVCHAAFHVIAWNYEQPTFAEHILWRGGSLCLLLNLFVWGAVEVLSVKPGFNFTVTLLGVWEKKTTKPTFWREWLIDGPAILAVVMYFVAKGLLLAVSFSSLRLLPVSAFQAVQWTSFLPHV